jgi:hypothetical protein
MNNFLKPIETHYKGYKFRSRLEARWAVFFDEMRFKWEYESQGFSLSNGQQYLPDFKISSVNNTVHWYEIKPFEDVGDGTMAQFEKDFNKQNPNNAKTYFRVLSGDPFQVLEPAQFSVCPRCGLIGEIESRYETLYFFSCEPCDYNTPSGSGNPVDNSGIVPCYPHKGALMVYQQDYRVYKGIVSYACQQARSARFEHNFK